jgi:hypothetical protein
MKRTSTFLKGAILALPGLMAFETTSPAPAHRDGGHTEDVNDDGFTDLVSHYRTQETGIISGNPDACVTGELFDGTHFEGCDGIYIIGR